MSIRNVYDWRRFIIAVTSVPLALFLLEIPLEARPAFQGEPVVRNVQLNISGDIAIITYDLDGDSETTYDVVAALVKEGDPNYRIPVKSATGDIGRGKFAGLQRRIQWDFRKDLPPDFAGGPEYSVEVNATMVKEGGGGSWVYYVLGGAVVAGGVVLLTHKSPSSTSSSTPLPSTPPGRPF